MRGSNGLQPYFRGISSLEMLCRRSFFSVSPCSNATVFLAGGSVTLQHRRIAFKDLIASPASHPLTAESYEEVRA